ncbi:hypothetical protein Syun_022913 [Stephania yunnanensis]|uniref:Myb/SANT-like domain-containing protein n=1 Tax=Stephania yunnanensis TaxID=152371 RepID=A0AAP0I1V7_9MAGN
MNKQRCNRKDRQQVGHVISQDESGDEVKASRRKRVHAEDVALINALFEMMNNGACKSKNGFKSGYLTHLEQAIMDVCPSSGIKAKLHIESHLKILKEWFIMNDMILDIKHGSSGFGFDAISNMIVSSNDV